MQLFVHLGSVIDRLAYLSFDDFAKAAAESVNGDFHRTLIQAESACGVGLENVFRVAGQPRLERLEMVGLRDSLVFLSEREEGAVK